MSFIVEKQKSMDMYLRDNPTVKLMNGALKFYNYDVIKGLFSETLASITTCLKRILENYEFDYVMLVGSFAQSALLQREIKNMLPSGTTKLLVPYKPELDIVEGSVLVGMRHVTSRIAKYSYGYNITKPFIDVYMMKGKDLDTRVGTGVLIYLNRLSERAMRWLMVQRSYMNSAP